MYIRTVVSLGASLRFELCARRALVRSSSGFKVRVEVGVILCLTAGPNRRALASDTAQVTAPFKAPQISRGGSSCRTAQLCLCWTSRRPAAKRSGSGSGSVGSGTWVRRRSSGLIDALSCVVCELLWLDIKGSLSSCPFSFRRPHPELPPSPPPSPAAPSFADT